MQSERVSHSKNQGGKKLNEQSGTHTIKTGCVPLPEWTGMDIITGMDYRNGHSAMALGALDMFYLHKMYFFSHMNSLHEIKFISVEQS